MIAKISPRISRWLPVALCGGCIVLAAWFGRAADRQTPPVEWEAIAPGVLRTKQLPAGYALVADKHALLIDAPHDPMGLRDKGIEAIDDVLLTHHHRDTCAAAPLLDKQRIRMRAAKASAEWLEPEKVQKFWKDNVPLRHSRTAAYLVAGQGVEHIECNLEDGQKIGWRGWNIQVVATPGHSKDHVSFLVRRDGDRNGLAFCGDLLAAPGKLWTPYTTDWDHWTDVGLRPTEVSLRKVAALKPDMLLPAHGAPIDMRCVEALEQAADRVREIAFLKSFERFTKQRLGNGPLYRFLAKEQAESNGSKPWSQISEHLFLTGNTYVLTSRDDRAFLVLDPWDVRSAKQVARLKQDRELGKLEVVMFSHAHNDHFDGIYHLPDREGFQVWTLGRVAPPLAEPYRYRAPFLDPRPVRFDRLMQDGESVQWHEYSLRFHHLPGQTDFTMGVETTIDGKRCYFTADNFFHQDQFSGSGGWMGSNRSFPLPYADSAGKVLAAAPEWVLAEHGGPFEFNAEDFRRRVRWGQVSAAAADAVCVSGNHRRDWDPNRIVVEPFLQKAKPGDTVRAKMVVYNPLPRPEKLSLRLRASQWTAEQVLTIEVPAHETVERTLKVKLNEKTPNGRHVFPIEASEGETPDGADTLFLIDVSP